MSREMPNRRAHSRPSLGTGGTRPRGNSGAAAGGTNRKKQRQNVPNASMGETTARGVTTAGCQANTSEAQMRATGSGASQSRPGPTEGTQVPVAISRRAGTGAVEKAAEPPVTVMIGDKRLKGSWEREFPVNGQGTLIFNTDRHMTPFCITVGDKSSNWIALLIGKDFAAFIMDGKTAAYKELICITEPGCGLEEGKASYWYSYDRDNLVLKYGKGYRMEETTLMKHDFLEGANDQDTIRKEMYPFFNAEGKKYVRQFIEDSSSQDPADDGIEVTEPLVEFDKNPFICNIPPLVLDSSKVNLFILDRGDFIFSASLPAACKELYQNILGCDLNYTEDTGEEVLLSDAIRYSINTDGCILHDRLEEKKGEFGSDPKETYLRVTLGHSLGKSPGIPYVLEIWPSGHYSPIHNHGNANAVIKVLFGYIRINVYNKTSDAIPEHLIKCFDARLGDITWINRNWYQTHKLHNKTHDYCATIQCYNYDAGDTTHWPYFDYLSENETIEEFFPDSDFDFLDMRTKVIAEYSEGMYDSNRDDE